MTVTVRHTATETDARDVEHLMNLDSTEVATLDERAACVERLREVQRAEVTLSHLGSDDIRRAADARHMAVGRAPS